METYINEHGVECCDNCGESVEDCACYCVECSDAVAECACEEGPTYPAVSER